MVLSHIGGVLLRGDAENQKRPREAVLFLCPPVAAIRRAGFQEAHDGGRKIVPQGGPNRSSAKKKFEPEYCPTPGVPGSDAGFRVPRPASRRSRFRMWPRAVCTAQKRD